AIGAHLGRVLNSPLDRCGEIGWVSGAKVETRLVVTHDLGERAGSARDDGQSGCECLHDRHGEILVALRWNNEKARVPHELHHALRRLLTQPLDSGTALIHPRFERTTADDLERVWRSE